MVTVPLASQAAPPSERLLPVVGGRTWIVERRGDLEAMWQQLGEADFGPDERMPYWVELWPSSLALGRWLAGQAGALAGRTCVDIGCGLGLSAMIGAGLGARVLAFDYEFAPLPFARRSAALNGVPQPLWIQMDWRAPALAPGCAAFAWGGDVMYELRFVEPVTALLDHVLAPGGRAWIAEPGRSIRQPFLDHAAARGFACSRALTERFEHQGHPVTVHILELRKPGGAHS
jgi:predicted nicotinamide N-methyase